MTRNDADARQHPHLTPADTWKSLFTPANNPEQKALQEEAQGHHSLFTPSLEPGHLEILRLLRDNEPDTITIAAVGPLTNLALAAAEDPETFLRVKEVVVMGGNVYEPGNVKPTSCPWKQSQRDRRASFPFDQTGSWQITKCTNRPQSDDACCRVQHLRRHPCSS
jgi:hypothetical protein